MTFANRPATAFLDIPFSETPASIRTEIKVSALTPTEAAKGPQLSIRELHTYLRWHPHLDRVKAMALAHDATARPHRRALHLSGGGADRAALWRAQRPAQRIRWRGRAAFSFASPTSSCNASPSAWASPATSRLCWRHGCPTSCSAAPASPSCPGCVACSMKHCNLACPAAGRGRESQNML